MTNTYFNYTSPLPRFTTADALRLNSTFNAIAAAFDKFPSAIELSQGTRNYSVATNIGGAYSITLPFVITGYTQGLQATFFASAANPTGATFNINGVGPSTLKRFDGTNLLANDIKAASINSVIFDGTNFRLTTMHGGSETLATTSATAAAASASQSAASAVQAATSASSAGISATTATSAASGATSAAASMRSGIRNLLLNPLFWLNQRSPGTLSGTAAAGVFVRDRWKAGTSGASWSVASQALTVTSGSVLQIVNGRNIHFTGTYTLSWTGTATGKVNGNTVANGGQVTLPGYQHASVEFSAGSFSFPQLEFSSVKTMFEIRPTDLEIQMCYQYYQKSYDTGVIPGASNTYQGVHIGIALTTIYQSTPTVTFPVKMRAIPTITHYSPFDGQSGFSYLFSIGNKSTHVSNQSESSFFLQSITGQLTVNSGVQTHWVADAEL